MNLILRQPLTYIFLLSILLFSCESNNSFRTEAGVRDQLEGKWQLVPIPRTLPIEIWEFRGGNITVTMLDRTPPRVFTGTYKVYTTITTPYIMIEGIPLSGKWIIITLDEKILSMDITSPGTNAISQREFIKI